MATEKRLIDANALSEKIGNMKFEITHNRGGYRYCNEDEKSEWDKLDGFDSLVCEAPTVDAVEVVHGRWVYAGGDLHYSGVLYVCSVCNKAHFVNARYALVTLHYHDEIFNNPKYCPNCGAKMDGERRTDNDG